MPTEAGCVGIDDKGKITGIDDHNELLELLPNKFRDILGVYGRTRVYGDIPVGKLPYTM